MIIVIMFSTFVAIFFQFSLYGASAMEGMENGSGADADADADAGADADADAGADAGADENFDNSIPLEPSEISGHAEHPMESNKETTNGGAPTVTKAAQLKKDMKDYFQVQERLLDVLEKAEPLQQEAMAIKERFSKHNDK
jgi:hypothetical protein